MNLSEYKQALAKPVRKRTLVFLTKGTTILLGLKKRGFGQGNFLGVGGKVEGHETITEAATREVEEEIGVTPASLRQVATLNFYFPHVVDESWNQQVHVFLSDRWQGEPTETDELKPQWFPKDSLPFDRMWDDARYWLPEVISGKSLLGDFLFDGNLKVTENEITEREYD